MERRLDFQGLISKVKWKIIRQFSLNLIIAYIIPISTVSLDVRVQSHSLGREMMELFFNVFSWIYICISLIIIVVVNTKYALKIVKREMDTVYRSSSELNPSDISPRLTLYEFIETNKHIEEMKAKIKDMIQIEKDQKEDLIFRVSAMAHDLKTPLTVIKGNSELLNSSDLSDTDRQCLTDIEKASVQLEKYFNQLISYSKTLHNDKLSLVPYNLQKFKEIIRQESQYLLTENIENTFSDHLYSDKQISIDLDLIIRAVTNVLNNAITYADNNHKRIEITLTEEENYLLIEVWNNGSEFSKEVLSNFGKLFYREDASRNYQAGHFGIGLAFVKQVMHLHSGELLLQNDGQGALVKLVLPIVSQDKALETVNHNDLFTVKDQK